MEVEVSGCFTIKSRGIPIRTKERPMVFTVFRFSACLEKKRAKNKISTIFASSEG